MSEQIPAEDYDEETDGPTAMKKLQHDKGRNFDRSRRHEQNSGGFTCSHCASFVPLNPEMGTAHRNHCNSCLWSKHVDIKPGDRASKCQSGMEPIAITLKIEGEDKYTNKQRLGDVMLVHKCTGCDACIVNRIAADDPASAVVSVFEKSQLLPLESQKRLQSMEINMMKGDEGRQLVSERLYGRQNKTR